MMECPKCGCHIQNYKNPLPTVDIIIETMGGIVLIERRNKPLGWALPGGFVDYGESLEQAAVREALEAVSTEAMFDSTSFCRRALMALALA